MHRRFRARRSISRSISRARSARAPGAHRRPINKDTELHPLVRWQFRAASREDERRAFLFTNVVDAEGRRYDMPVVVGALAASPQIYALGMGRPVEEIGQAWTHAIAHPMPPVASSVARPVRRW